MTNQEAIKIINSERECVVRASIDECDRDCAKCDLVMPDGDIIVAYDMATTALERQESRKPNNSGHEHDAIPSGFCPVCGTLINIMEIYCHYCGQKLDWGDENDHT